MSKRILRPTVSQSDIDVPLKGQVTRDHSALVIGVDAIKIGANVRTDLGDLEELTSSVIEHGIVQAISVARTPHGLELVTGHRRLEAAKRAGLTEVPVRVVNADENQIAVLRLVENIQREDLSGPDEILAVAKLSTIFPDQVQLAKAIGKSKSYVSRCLKAAQIVRSSKVATSQLSKSALFEIADSTDPTNALALLSGETKPTVCAKYETALS